MLISNYLYFLTQLGGVALIGWIQHHPLSMWLLPAGEIIHSYLIRRYIQHNMSGGRYGHKPLRGHNTCQGLPNVPDRHGLFSSTLSTMGEPTRLANKPPPSAVQCWLTARTPPTRPDSRSHKSKPNTKSLQSGDHSISSIPKPTTRKTKHNAAHHTSSSVPGLS